jgi:hypothetical protein
VESVNSELIKFTEEGADGSTLVVVVRDVIAVVDVSENLLSVRLY